MKELEPHLTAGLKTLSGGTEGTSGTMTSAGADAKTVVVALWSGVPALELGPLLEALTYEER